MANEQVENVEKREEDDRGRSQSSLLEDATHSDVLLNTLLHYYCHSYTPSFG